jgi:hypothetical protein
VCEDYVVRPYQEGDEGGITELLVHVFEGWPKFDLKCKPIDHWMWKHRDNPLGKSIIIVAEKKGEIIGCAHEVKIRLKIGENIYDGAFGADDGVHKAFRRLGIWKKMSNLKNEILLNSNILFDFSITENPILIKHRKRSSNYLFYPRDLILVSRIKSIKNHLKMTNSRNIYLKYYGFKFLRLLNKIRNIFKVKDSSKDDFEISSILHFDHRINDFWNNIKNDYNFIVERECNYLNWRYLDPRSGNYIVKAAKSNGKILGYIVLNINSYHKEYPVGHIADLVALPDRVDVAYSLVDDAMKYFEEKNVNVIRSQIIKNSLVDVLLSRYDFIKIRNKPCFTFDLYQKNEDLIRFLKSPAKQMHFVPGDYDAI